MTRICTVWIFLLVLSNDIHLCAEAPTSNLLLTRKPTSYDKGYPENRMEFPHIAQIINASDDPKLLQFVIDLGHRFRQLRRGSPSLAKLVIEKTTLTPEQARQLETIATESLTISNCDVSDEVAQSLGRIRVAGSLTFVQLRMSDQAWMSLGRTECSMLTLKQVQMSDLGLSGLLSGKSRMKVEALEIRGCTTEGWRPLTNIADLDDIRLTDCDFDDHALLHLSSSKCRALHVKNGQLTGSTLGALKNLKDCLRSLSLSGCPINDQGVQLIGGFSKLGALDLSKTLVTDIGLQSLPEFSELETLDLTGTEVTDDGFRNFKILPNLSHIKVAGTKVTQAWAIEISRRYQDQRKSSRPLTVSFPGDPRWPPLGGYCVRGEFVLLK